MFFCLQCDGVSLDLSNGPSLEGIALLNIPSIYGGISLWGEGNRHKNRKTPANFQRKDSYVYSEFSLFFERK